MDESVDRLGHLGGLIEVVEVAGPFHPFDPNIGTLCRHICKNGWRLCRVAVGLQLEHREGKVVLADFADSGVDVPVSPQKIFRVCFSDPRS